MIVCDEFHETGNFETELTIEEETREKRNQVEAERKLQLGIF